MPITRPKRIFAAVYHSLIDTSSGAAISLRDMLEELAERNWEVRVLSGPMLDFEGPKTNEDLLREQGVPYQTYRAHGQGEEFTLCMFRLGHVNYGAWLPANPQASPSQLVGGAWLTSYRELLDAWNPDVVLTYGGYWMTRPMMQLAKKAGAKTMFLLCNYAYSDPSLFNDVDVTIVRSHFHAKWCRDTLGIKGIPLPSLITPARHLCERSQAERYVTFVNPQPHKGVFLFAKLAEVLGRDRPDIPLLVVEGRASTDWLNRTGANLAAANLFRMPNTPDPRDYLRATHIMLVPSVWQESFGRVAAEAMMNGIPVIGSTRGALPEVIGEAGVLLDIPERITPDSRELPTDEDILPWKQAIERLWDDPEYYAEIAKRAKSRAELWSVDSIVAEFERL